MGLDTFDYLASAEDLDAPGGIGAVEISWLALDNGLRVAGEIDASTASSLAQALNELEAVEAVVLDLREVTFIDSTGVQVILACARSLTPKAVPLVIRPSTPVLRIFDLAALGSLAVVDIQMEDVDVEAA